MVKALLRGGTIMVDLLEAVFVIAIDADCLDLLLSFRRCLAMSKIASRICF